MTTANQQRCLHWKLFNVTKLNSKVSHQKFLIKSTVVSALTFLHEKSIPNISQFILDQYLFNSCGIKHRFKFITAPFKKQFLSLVCRRHPHDREDEESSKTNRKNEITLGFNLIKPSHLGRLRAFIMIVILSPPSPSSSFLSDFNLLHLQSPPLICFCYHKKSYTQHPFIQFLFVLTVYVLISSDGTSKKSGRRSWFLFLPASRAKFEEKTLLGLCLLT